MKQATFLEDLPSCSCFSKHPRVFPDEQLMLTMAHVSPKGGSEFSEGCDLYCISLSQGGERHHPGDYAYGGPE